MILTYNSNQRNIFIRVHWMKLEHLVNATIFARVTAVCIACRTLPFKIGIIHFLKSIISVKRCQKRHFSSLFYIFDWKFVKVSWFIRCLQILHSWLLKNSIQNITFPFFNRIMSLFSVDRSLGNDYKHGKQQRLPGSVHARVGLPDLLAGAGGRGVPIAVHALLRGRTSRKWHLGCHKLR